MEVGGKGQRRETKRREIEVVPIGQVSFRSALLDLLVAEKDVVDVRPLVSEGVVRTVREVFVRLPRQRSVLERLLSSPSIQTQKKLVQRKHKPERNER